MLRKYRPLLFQLCLLALCMTMTSLDKRNQIVSDGEYKIKAVFLYNFARFVEWPSAAFTESQSPIVIGVLGENPFGSFLDETVKGEKVNERPLITMHFDKVSDVTGCHILFISKSTEKYETIISALKGKNILTVSDVSGFTKSGGMIRFLSEDNKVKLMINLEAAKAEQLVISSKLLRIAKIVESQNQ